MFFTEKYWFRSVGKNPKPLACQPPSKMEAYVSCCRKLQGLEDVSNDMIFVKRVATKANKRRDYMRSKAKKSQISAGKSLYFLSV